MESNRLRDRFRRCAFDVVRRGHALPTRRWALHLLLGAAAVPFWASCDSPSAPGPGEIRIQISTTGGDPDEDGYVVVTGERQAQATAAASFTWPNMSAGAHSVELTGVAGNCTVVGDNPRSVTVTTGTTTQVEFLVTCDATGVAVTIVTNGPDMPPPFLVTVGTGTPRPALGGTTLVVSRLEPGTYTVVLGNVPDGCALAGEAEVTVEVINRAVTNVEYHATCGALNGVIEFTVSTTGVDLDSNGYTVFLDNLRYADVPANGTVRVSPVPAGTHTVRLGGAASNCTPAGGSERTVTLTAGGATRDTARVAFDLTCVRTQKIAYVEGDQIVVAHADGSHLVRLVRGHSPAWAPDGRRIVYSNVECEYYGYYCSGGLQIVDAETGQVTPLAGGAVGLHPAWSSDGQRVAFVKWEPNGSTYLSIIVLDGSPPLAIVPPPVQVKSVSDPSWSPDGQRLVFGCVIAVPSADICTVNRDGSGFKQLTHTDSWNYSPAWSPDGSRIVFSTSRFGTGDLALMTPDGSGVTRLTSGFHGSWLPDGSAILFARQSGIHMINVDGSALTKLTTGLHYEPKWRP